MFDNYIKEYEVVGSNEMFKGKIEVRFNSSKIRKIYINPNFDGDIDDTVWYHSVRGTIESYTIPEDEKIYGDSTSDTYVPILVSELEQKLLKKMHSLAHAKPFNPNQPKETLENLGFTKQVVQPTEYQLAQQRQSQIERPFEGCAFLLGGIGALLLVYCLAKMMGC